MLEVALVLSLVLLPDRVASKECQVKKSLEGTLSLKLSRMPLLPLAEFEVEGVGKRLLLCLWLGWHWASWAWW